MFYVRFISFVLPVERLWDLRCVILESWESGEDMILYRMHVGLSISNNEIHRPRRV